MYPISNSLYKYVLVSAPSFIFILFKETCTDSYDKILSIFTASRLHTLNKNIFFLNMIKNCPWRQIKINYFVNILMNFSEFLFVSTEIRKRKVYFAENFQKLFIVIDFFTFIVKSISQTLKNNETLLSRL